MNIKGAKTLKQLAELHNNAIAQNSNVERFEDMEKDEKIKESVSLAFDYYESGNFEKALNANIAHQLAYEEYVNMYNAFYSLYCEANKYGSDLLQQAIICAVNLRYKESLNFLTAFLFFKPGNIKAHLLYAKIKFLFENETNKLE